MNAPPITPLDAWIVRKIGVDSDSRLDRDRLERYQLDALNRTLGHVRRHSPFYRQRLRRLTSEPLPCLNDLTSVPLTDAGDLRRDPHAFLCVSQSRIARAVTLDTSGTTGRPKRLFFSEADQALTVDFFHHGMAALVHPDQRVLILMPGTTPGSVGDLLVRALARMAVAGVVYGPVTEPHAAVETALHEKIDCLVGIPVQVLAMACHPRGRQLAGRIKTVLLSTDYVPDAIVDRLERAWGCRVFKHYGMTEMGLGGAVECAARFGGHWREADLLVEIIDPQSGVPVHDGMHGEVVFTTLTREAMPLIRYRTGDLAAFRVDSCPCGTVLKTVDTIRGRLDGRLTLNGGATLFIGDLDEAVFALDGVMDYTADLSRSAGADQLTVRIHASARVRTDRVMDRIREAVQALPPVRAATTRGTFQVAVVPADCPVFASTGGAKRRIIDRR